MQCHTRAVEAVCGTIGGMIAPQRRETPKIVRWVGVTFHHTHSREREPHLHTHLAVPNIGKNAAGQWRAVQVVLAGKNRNRLACTYAHELSRQLRRSGLGAEIVTRRNALPEIRSLRPLANCYSTAGNVVRAGDKPVQPTPGEPVELHSRSRLPVPPNRAEIRIRQKRADEIRKPKRRASDDPVRLSDEARRWQGKLTNAEFRGVTQTLDLADPFRRSREGVKPEPLPPPVSAVIRAEVELERRKAAKAKRRALHEADSLAMAEAHYAEVERANAALARRAVAASTEMTRTAQNPSQGAAPGGAAAPTPAAVPTPTAPPGRGRAQR